MIEAGDIPKTSLANFKSEAIMHWDSVFKLDKLRASVKSRLIRGYRPMVKTDERPAGFHYMRPWRPEDDPSYRRAMPGGDGVYHWGVDPGHHNIMFAARRCGDGSYHTERLTKNHYYGETGFDKGRRQRANWTKRELADEAGAFEGTVLKTSDEAKNAEYTAALSRVFVQSWRVKTKRKASAPPQVFHRTTTSPGPVLRQAQGAGWIRSSHRVRRRQIPLFTKRVGSGSAPTTSVRSVPPWLPPHRRRRRIPHELGVPNVRHATVRGYKPTYERVGARVPTVPVARVRRAPFLSRGRPRGDKHPPVPRGGVGGAPRPGFLRRSAQDGWVRPTRGFSCENAEISKKDAGNSGVVSSASALVIPPFCKLSQPCVFGLGSTRRWTSAVLGARSRASTLLVARDAGRIPTVGDLAVNIARRARKDAARHGREGGFLVLDTPSQTWDSKFVNNFLLRK